MKLFQKKLIFICYAKQAIWKQTYFSFNVIWCFLSLWILLSLSICSLQLLMLMFFSFFLCVCLLRTLRFKKIEIINNNYVHHLDVFLPSPNVSRLSSFFRLCKGCNKFWKNGNIVSSFRKRQSGCLLGSFFRPTC